MLGDDEDGLVNEVTRAAGRVMLAKTLHLDTVVQKTVCPYLRKAGQKPYCAAKAADAADIPNHPVPQRRYDLNCTTAFKMCSYFPKEVPPKTI
ncbi:hypothetical protein C4573_06965 [Candidatus Woesearchaeota archaeon]|nr:MAG: hypothetical protein C4573_06965 [Candidatus Woesearchaeota archaeon]